MHFVLRAVPQDAFAQWLTTAQQAGPALDRTGYNALSQQSRNVAPFTYRAVEPNLFEAVVTQQIPPAPGPSAGRGGPGVPVRSQ
jgi:cytochrome o ubiquinol oxidase subunit 2